MEANKRYGLSSVPVQRHIADLRQTFFSVDEVGELYVFNIGGNKWRLIATIAYSLQIVWVKHVLTHTEYDKGAWK